MATDSKYLHSDISNLVLQAFYTVRNILPFNLTTDTYRQALVVEMELLGLTAQCDKLFDILYRDKVVGLLRAEVVVNDRIVLKLLYTEGISEQSEAELKNLLRYSDCEVGLILNFYPDEQHKRLVLTADRKKKAS
jgi:GxxExxY protein